MSLHKLAAATVLVALSAGCATTLPLLVTPSPIASPGTGNPGPTPKCGPPSTCGGLPSPTVAPTPAGPSAEIEIDISGGPHSGSYRAVAVDGCDSKPAQNRFTVTYADDAAADGFVALHLVLRDAALAQEDESSDFEAQIRLGGAAAGISYTIDPVNGASSGTALLEITQLNAMLDLTAATPDGAHLELTVICGSP